MCKSSLVCVYCLSVCVCGKYRCTCSRGCIPEPRDQSSHWFLSPAKPLERCKHENLQIHRKATMNMFNISKVLNKEKDKLLTRLIDDIFKYSILKMC